MPHPDPPTKEHLQTLIQPITKRTKLTRTLPGAFLTFNCCSLKDNDTPDDYQRVTPYPGKAFLLQQQFADKNVLVAGLQETHPREPGFFPHGCILEDRNALARP